MAHTMGEGKRVDYVEYPLAPPHEQAYIVFAGDWYYPRGGWKDYQGVHTTPEDAQAAAEALVNGECDWAEVIHLNDSRRWIFQGDHRGALQDDLPPEWK